MPQPSKWTKHIFVDHAELYGEVLESLKPRAAADVRGLRRLLAREGVPPRGRLLDIACGIGRHVVPLASAGYEVVGSDFSPAYVARAREYAARRGLGEDRLRCIVSDYRKIDRTLTLARERPFDVAFALFTSLGHYGEAGDLAVLRAVRKVVRPGGLFVLEMGSRDWVVAHFKPKGKLLAGPDSSLEIREERTFDWATSTISSKWTFFRRAGGRRRRLLEEVITVRMYSLHELRSLFERAGWQFVRAYGDLVTLEPVSFRSHRLVVVGRRPTR